MLILRPCTPQRGTLIPLLHRIKVRIQSLPLKIDKAILHELNAMTLCALTMQKLFLKGH